jgi:peptidoglycan/LPS O-acetylase OafA/YrhL
VKVSTEVRASATTPAGGRFRGDIDGLRAVAIVLVVAFHAGLTQVSGGFVGVDVFFVISGYLITTNLLDESRRRGEIDLLRFWAKRVRRLVPALALMLVVTLGLAVAVLGVLEWQTVADDARAAALYVSNIYFAEQATDYFAADVTESLYLHTWSLGVEEQFYLVWPLLVVAATLLVRRRTDRLKGVLVVAFALTLVVSFGLSVWLTDRGSPWAFFGLPTRAWEFAAAGLLAAAPLSRLRLHRGVATALAASGLALIAGAALRFSDLTPYPGYRAAVPVVGTLLVIVAGSAVERPNPLSTALALRPAQWIGRVSYSWYLWHWPLILLAVAWFETDRRLVTGGAALVSLAVAAAAYHLFENPVRFSVRLTRSSPRTFAVGALITAVALLATVGVTQYAEVEIADAGPAAELERVRDQRRAFDCPHRRQTDSGIEYCEAGDLDASDTVLLTGDSHTRHWSPAFIQAADEEGFRLLIRWRGACPSTNVAVADPAHERGESPVDRSCTEFQRDTDELIDQLDPDTVVLSNTSSYVVIADRPIYHPDGQARIWGDALRERILGLQADGRSVGVVIDTPRLPDDPIPCLVDADDPADCAVPRAEAEIERGVKIEAAEQMVIDELGDVPTLDVTPILCPDDLCLMHLNGQYVYGDNSHMYDRFVETLTPEVVAFLDEARSLATRED